MKKAVLFVMSFMLLQSCAQTSSSNSLNPLDGDWTISSSVGGVTPITVYCSIRQMGSVLSGTCTPEMENPEAADLNGMVEGSSANWGYDVVFNGNPGRVDFMADSFSSSAISGTLSLSGTEAPFTAVKQ